MTADAPLSRNQKYAITCRWQTFAPALWWGEDAPEAFRFLLNQEEGRIAALLALSRRAHARPPDYDARRAVIAVWEGLDPGVQTRLRHAAQVAMRSHLTAQRRERLAAALAGGRRASVWDIFEELLDPPSQPATDRSSPDERRRQFRVVR